MILNNVKIIQERLDQVGGSHNVIDFMCNKKTKIAIILDEIDGLSSGDKGGMSEINNIIQSNKDKNPLGLFVFQIIFVRKLIL